MRPSDGRAWNKPQACRGKSASALLPARCRSPLSKEEDCAQISFRLPCVCMDGTRFFRKRYRSSRLAVFFSAAFPASRPLKSIRHGVISTKTPLSFAELPTFPPACRALCRAVVLQLFRPNAGEHAHIIRFIYRLRPSRRHADAFGHFRPGSPKKDFMFRKRTDRA